MTRRERGRLLLLHNPGARAAPEPALLARLEALLRASGWEVAVRGSRRPEEIPALVRRAALEEGFGRLAVCGGDGTVRQAAEGLRGTQVPLALLPMGTANVLARELGIPRSPLLAADLAARGTPRRVPLGLIGGEIPFTFCASAGLDSLAVAGLDTAMKRETGAWAYGYAALRALLEAPLPLLRVHPEGALPVEAAQVFVLRGRRYGGEALLTSSEVFFRPVLKVLAVAPPLAPRLPRLAWGLLRGGLEGLPGVHAFEARRVLLEGPHGFPLEADGDVAAGLPVQLSVEEGALFLVVPDKAPGPSGGG